MKIYLMRHSETEYNRQKLFYGVTDVSINEKGKQQAQLLQKKLAGLPKNLIIYTSQLTRTIETAKIIFPNHPLHADPYFNEKSFGLWEGLDANAIEAKFPQEWAQWLAAPFTYTPPEADNFQEFAAQVLTGFEKIKAQDVDFALVGHLGVLRVILHKLFPEKNFWDIELEQGCYTELEYSNQQLHIKKWNQ